MNDPADPVKLVEELKSRQRGRACVVLTHEYAGQNDWAAELARMTDSDHIDLLECFAKDETLSARIGEFNASKLFDFLKEKSKSPVLIVSGIEFLKSTWSGQTTAINQFIQPLETRSTPPSLLFVMQYDKRLSDYKSTRYQYSLVVDQKETLALR